MKRSMFSARRWFVILILSLLLCGAGTSNFAAAPDAPSPDPQAAVPTAPPWIDRAIVPATAAKRPRRLPSQGTLPTAGSATGSSTGMRWTKPAPTPERW